MTKSKFGHDEIENNLISAYIENRDLFVKCEHLVSSAIFSESHTRWAYKKIKAFHQKGVKPDAILLMSEARKESLPKEFTALIGGFIGAPYEYSTQPEQYVDILFKRYVANYLFPILSDASLKLQDFTDDSLEIMYAIKEAITKVELVVNNVSKEKDVHAQFDEMVQRIIDLKNGVIEQNGFSFGLTELDAKTGGVNVGLNIIAATPGGGKTSLLINIMKRNAIDLQEPMLVFSLEMPAIEILTNLTSNVVQLNSRALREGGVEDSDILTIKQVKERIKSNLEIDDTGGINWQYVEAKVRAYRTKHNIPKKKKLLVAIDFLQLFKNSQDEMKMSKEERIETTVNELARICKSENLALILLSQFSRQEKDRKSPRPRTSDLKGSSAIEAAAILILLLFRPEYHGIFEDNDGTNLRGLCEINIAKARYAYTQPIYARFLGKYSQFLDYIPDSNGINTSGEDFF